MGFGLYSQTFVLHEGAEQPARDFILSCAAYMNTLHEEIWVFNQVISVASVLDYALANRS
jgi:hypothetical protein